MKLLQLLGRGGLLLLVLLGMTACGQKGPLILPPKNTPPQAVNPIIFPDETAEEEKVQEEQQTEQTPKEEETPLGILPSTTQHKSMNAK